MGYKTETHRHRQEYGGYQRKEVGEVVKCKGGQIYGDGRGLTLGGGHTMQYTNYVSEICILETYMILLANVTSINFIRNEFLKKNVEEKEPLCTVGGNVNW